MAEEKKNEEEVDDEKAMAEADEKNDELALVEKAARLHRVEHRHRHSLEFLLHPFHEVQRNVRLYGHSSAWLGAVAAEHNFCCHSRSPLPHCTEIDRIKFRSLFLRITLRKCKVLLSLRYEKEHYVGID